MAVDCLILVVDDDHLNRLVVQRAVQKVFPQISLREAATAGEALHIVQHERVTSLITDFHLPDGTGLDILTAFLAQNPAQKSLVLSGDPRTEDIVLSAGANWFLAKPVNLADLLAVIRQLC